LFGILAAHSQVWDPQRLAPVPVAEPAQVALERPINTINFQRLMAAYSTRYHFAEQMLLISAYHQNAVSRCLQALEAFSPDAVLANAGRAFKQSHWKLSEQIVERMNSVADSCVGKSMTANLVELKKTMSN
jgi:hypothetical protein